ncbi:YdcF family protein [Baaleninema simplex]|uniref:YdcF family protein n=1 Tax=Baaleninema simplex TaxID=2862350 RepID=UPI000348F3A8|nr:YdcF family protein [Baaleninema simplex]
MSSPTSSTRRRKRWFIAIGVGLFLALLLVVGKGFVLAYQHAKLPLDAVFVLGGSIKRELYISKYARSHPDIPILISSGSQPPCIYLIFQRDNAPMDNVWLENCARSTFDNFYYGLPILERWGVRRVKLVTSASHLPRSLWLAQIVLGAHGIWVEPEIVPEVGVPGNNEFFIKTILDVMRSLLWAVISQIYTPACQQETHLADVDIEAWKTSGFRCEHQAQIKDDSN